MNYYNPYMNMAPYTSLAAQVPSKAGLFSGLLKGGRALNWGSILANTQRTLGLINQAIPVVKQVTPVFRNAKTVFQVMNEFKKSDDSTKSTNKVTNRTDKSVQDATDNTAGEGPNNVTDEGPKFFI